jgi:hypothetical protein
MIYQESLRQLKKLGCAHATGDSLRAMYAGLIVSLHGGDSKTAGKFYFPHLAKRSTDEEITNEARELLRDRAASWDVIMGIRK